MKENEERKLFEFNGVYIPMEIWLDENLSIIEKQICREIIALSKPKESCFASNRHFSERMNTSEIEIQKCIENIKKQGYLSVVYLCGTRYLRIKYPGDDFVFFENTSVGYTKNTNQNLEEQETPLVRHIRIINEKLAENTKDIIYLKASVDVLMKIVESLQELDDGSNE